MSATVARIEAPNFSLIALRRRQIGWPSEMYASIRFAVGPVAQLRCDAACPNRADEAAADQALAHAAGTHRNAVRGLPPMSSWKSR
jgi:hypothetical protein